ncbi:hypothetical protein [unidentified bacterial endosymbiont]|uniref:hypothetical protein n=1 Tax=unidentified bacterial endosymbiont TaxID=2355 RepID=UPI00209C96A9|nr:hypothetical protein [unidentified bacterial endosymbiont]
MHEGTLESTRKPPKGMTRPRFMTGKGFVLAHHPAHQVILLPFNGHNEEEQSV